MSISSLAVQDTSYRHVVAWLRERRRASTDIGVEKMSSKLEQQLESVPERWRDETRTRAYAVMDFLNAGEDGPLLLKVLCKRVGLSRSMFYRLVGRWKESGGNAAALTPFAKKPGAQPRIAKEVTHYLDRAIELRLARDPSGPAEPIVREVLLAWPESLHKPGLSYIRKRVAQVRADLEKKTGRRLRSGPFTDKEVRIPEGRWPLDVIVVDHVAVGAVVFGSERSGDGAELWRGPTLPIVTIAIDAITSTPVALRLGVHRPQPGNLLEVLAEVARFALERGAPGPPKLVFATTTQTGWQEAVRVLAATGVAVMPWQARKLHFGTVSNEMLGGMLAGYALSPRTGHRHPAERLSTRSVMEYPYIDLEDLESQLLAAVHDRRIAALAANPWPRTAPPAPEIWRSLDFNLRGLDMLDEDSTIIAPDTTGSDGSRRA